MEDATRDLLGLWDVTDGLVGGLGPDDWRRPLAVSGFDVSDLAAHLAGAGVGGRSDVRTALTAARDRTVAQVRHRPAGDRLLGAHCLDMCVHAHDLGAAVGRPVDLDDHAAAVREACRLVVGFLPRLLVATTGGHDSAVRVLVRGEDGPDLDRTVHVAAGALVDVAATPAPATADVIEIAPAALVLLLSGRRDAESLYAEGSLRSSGGIATAFLHHARLPGGLS